MGALFVGCVIAGGGRCDYRLCGYDGVCMGVHCMHNLYPCPATAQSLCSPPLPTAWSPSMPHICSVLLAMAHPAAPGHTAGLGWLVPTATVVAGTSTLIPSLMHPMLALGSLVQAEQQKQQWRWAETVAQHGGESDPSPFPPLGWWDILSVAAQTPHYVEIPCRWSALSLLPHWVAQRQW